MPGTERSAAVSRRDLADRFAALLPALKQRFQASLPPDLRAELTRVTPHQLEALHVLHTLRAAEEGRGITMHDLAEAQHCALSTATALADRLIAQDLAERVTDPADRRVVRIAPTARGTRLTQRFADTRRETVLRALEPLSDEEVAALVELLSKATKTDSSLRDEEAAYG